MLQQVLADLKESGSNETKSTAGDKHETALAMLQIEQESYRGQLKEAMNQKEALMKLDPLVTAGLVVNCSLVKTDKGYLYISIAEAKSQVDGITVIPLSPQSPLGSKLVGLSAGDTAVINNNRFAIELIL